ncbi:MAG: hypothetical protein HRU03_05210 [Nanoarchaeales archaeon]|nr:hypothetical protein [Nanoarchaeales archaeon]
MFNKNVEASGSGDFVRQSQKYNLNGSLFTVGYETPALKILTDFFGLTFGEFVSISSNRKLDIFYNILPVGK